MSYWHCAMAGHDTSFDVFCEENGDEMLNSAFAKSSIYHMYRVVSGISAVLLSLTICVKETCMHKESKEKKK